MTPYFTTYSPHVGAFYFVVQFKPNYPGEKDGFFRELFGALLLQIRNGYSKSSNYAIRMTSSQWMLSADVKAIAIMQPEGCDHALNFEKMLGLELHHSIVKSCRLHERHYEDESRLFGYFSM